MSYDLMVFEKSKAPNNREEFLKWYEKQVQWEEDHDYQSVSVTSENLKKWFLEMKETFPPMNGEYAPSDEAIEEEEELEDSLTDYSIGHDVIYAAFSWSKADDAYHVVKKLATVYDVGFYDVSGDGDIILPDGTKL